MGMQMAFHQCALECDWPICIWLWMAVHCGRIQPKSMHVLCIRVHRHVLPLNVSQFHALYWRFCHIYVRPVMLHHYYYYYCCCWPCGMDGDGDDEQWLSILAQPIGIASLVWLLVGVAYSGKRLLILQTNSLAGRGNCVDGEQSLIDVRMDCILVVLRSWLAWTPRIAMMLVEL